MCVDVCLHEHMLHVCKCSWRSGEDMRSSGAGVPFVCEPLDVGPLEGQEVIITAKAFLWYPRYYKLRWTEVSLCKIKNCAKSDLGPVLNQF